MTNIFDEVKSNKNYNPNRSVEWFRQNVRLFSQTLQLTPTKLLTQSSAQGQSLKQSKQIYPGQMVMFSYSAKGKDTLPYWDKFPLVLPFAASKTHFTGLNLHYLSPAMRVKLLDSLLASRKGKMRPNDRLKLNWQMLQSVSKYPQVAPCVKQYLFNHVKTNFIVIPPEDWPIAIHLPVERFVGQKDTAVWNNSSRQVRSVR